MAKNAIQKAPKTHKEPLIYITKRTELPKKNALLIKGAVIVAGVVFCALIAILLTGVNPLMLFKSMFEGSFGNEIKMWNLFKDTAILLGISLAVTPAFKMRFWNTGAEGQVLIGMLASVVCMRYLGNALPSWLLIIVMLVASIVAGAIWAGIPGVFKAMWNTNETLFTLMMNYVAMQLVSFLIMLWVPTGSMVLGLVNPDTKSGWFPALFGQDYLMNILIVAVLTVLVYIYLSKSKQGYEISVVGESENTARYIGINVKKVIIRTVLISGALCGIMGWIMVAGANHSIAANSVGGTGFTAIMISWMSKFNPVVMIFSSLLVCFLQKGAVEIASDLRLDSSVGDVLAGIMILFIISSEFFVTYKVHFRKKAKKEVNE